MVDQSDTSDDRVRFVLNGEVRSIARPDPTSSLLSWLRYDARLTGTKEGCAEGDCGACTVVVGERRRGKIRYRALNACTLFLPMVDGREVITVEALSTGERLHPVQQAMVTCHGSQCGFCTPGFVMSLFARYEGKDDCMSGDLNDCLAGNLCRCTGYGPIQQAGDMMTSLPAEGLKIDEEAAHRRLDSLARTSPLAYRYDEPATATTKHFFAPKSLAALLSLKATYPNATLVAGATDVALWVNKDFRVLIEIISVNDVEELRSVTEDDTVLTIGAGVRYTDALGPLVALYPAFGRFLSRLGATQVRNSGTIGGNIANGSPIGDSPPALIALGATLVLASSSGERRLPLEEFFLDYGKQDLRPDEIVKAIIVPKRSPDQLVAFRKISKRFDQDISAVCGAFSLHVSEGIIRSARVAFGGMAATPRRAHGCEAALAGARLSMEGIAPALRALTKDFTPLSDLRATAAYRQAAAQALLAAMMREVDASTAPIDLYDIPPIAVEATNA
ncbi:hypothetical protein PB2503_11559 [Parvularcula bermudensis HTCC2503]|uniref:Xanthine dehydrogenase n=1 Tax=Parvularcula bermudensis (strain ATCC BAA-594 / HTCC2503 / KCTC 12087) TaxID=314260 RepID=E0TCX4_PARBH|nr:xanthine dehydrogenase small subunit [Parvularcula bermudensis]ADM10357.1 hypothetical protein PB2503_11559 [Parvularcula bermudensis HTCC2503]